MVALLEDDAAADEADACDRPLDDAAYIRSGHAR